MCGEACAGVQELLKKEVVGIDDLQRILGKRPFVNKEMQNIDRFRGELRGLGEWVSPKGVWEWIESFRSPGLRLAGVGDAGGDEGDDDGESGDGEDDDDEGGGGGGGGGGLWWQGLGTGRRYPVAT